MRMSSSLLALCGLIALLSSVCHHVMAQDTVSCAPVACGTSVQTSDFISITRLFDNTFQVNARTLPGLIVGIGINYVCTGPDAVCDPTTWTFSGLPAGTEILANAASGSSPGFNCNNWPNGAASCDITQLPWDLLISFGCGANSGVAEITFTFTAPAGAIISFPDGTDLGLRIQSIPGPLGTTLSSRAVCPSVGQVHGDPAFTGFRGQKYQVHGIAGEVYNIISSPAMQYNARFAFLDKGKCPINEQGKASTTCFSHPGTYLQELGLQLRVQDDDKEGEKEKEGESVAYDQSLHVVAGSAEHGFKAVEVQGKTLPMGHKLSLAYGASPVRMSREEVESSCPRKGYSPDLSPLSSASAGYIEYPCSHTLILRHNAFLIRWENSDKFVNQIVRTIEWEQVKKGHGLLGYSWQGGKLEGSVEDYRVEEGEVFGNDFKFNKFMKA